MPKPMTHITFLFLFLTALSGVWMRLLPMLPNITFPYDNVLHAHSHLAILGWTFLSVVIIFLTLYWRQLQAKTEAKLLLTTLTIVTLIMFLTFLYQSYGLYSIIMSTLHIFIEYWVVTFIYRMVKRIKDIPKISLLFIKAALISLVLSSFGPFSLGFISAAGFKDSFWFDIAIYFYLHFQYNGWLFLFLIGLFIIILDKRGFTTHHRLISIGFWLYALALFPSYFASVLWVEHGTIVSVLATIGTMGQWLAVICILLSFLRITGRLYQYEMNWTITSLGIVFTLLFFKSTMELGLIFPGLASLVFETRSVIIGYLHLTFLGFVSLFILVQYIMLDLLPMNRYTSYGLGIFLIGFSFNELLLFMQGLFTWLQLGHIPFYNESLLIASLLLCLGIIVLWIALSEKSLQKAPLTVKQMEMINYK